MTTPIASVVRVASTPAQAKIFVALLRAEGIPAFVEGDSLADEVAVSRTLINLNGTRVMVPTGSIEHARNVLGAAEIEEEDLAKQAMAADQPESLMPTPPPTGTASRWPLVLTTCAAIAGFTLWLGALETNASTTTALAHETTSILPNGTICTWTDENGDGHFDRCVVRRANGEVLQQLRWHDGSGYLPSSR